ncbi:hypothetical protein CTI12_AA324280 [Artemisia annua]|uniref:Uncharacterized protein n=1 Tax=Artemisia annua TaxID=35608 RepID=A0A2U1MZW5_ARTAN|nr:hypothetical protein CTI12_AA324280 [Artemisia annua]
MAYRRKPGLSRSSTFKEDMIRRPDQDDTTTTSSSKRRLDAFRSSSCAFHSSFNNRSKPSTTYDFTSMKSTNEPRGFWGVLARKAKAILDDEGTHQSNSPINAKPEKNNFSTTNQVAGIQVPHQYEQTDHLMKMDRPDEKKAQECHQETHEQPQMKQETQLQASRGVAIATTAKVKQLVRELKNVKAELAFAKELCSELEEENKTLREVDEKEDHPADDIIRVQIEMLLEEKGRLVNENSEYSRENRHLREIVEFHQLSMQDVMYLDEDEDFKELTKVDILQRTLSSPV